MMKDTREAKVAGKNIPGRGNYKFKGYSWEKSWNV
jgi:hypothetical protein